MEIDLFKESWQLARESGVPLAGREEIVTMLGQRSKSPVATMKRNVAIELLLVVVMFGTVAAFYFVSFKGRFSEIAWMYLALMGLSVFYYYRKWRLLDTMQCSACQVKSNLQLQVNTLEKYVLLYVRLSTAMLPLVLVFLGVLFHYKFPAATGWFFPFFPASPMGSVITWLGLVLVVTGVAYWLFRWYVRRLYGQHIQQLKRLLAEMDE